MGKVIIKKTSNDGYHFTVVANNGQVVGVSQTYKSLKSAKSGIESVKRNRNSYIEDQTVPDFKELGFPKWQIFKDAAGDFRFRLVAMNGETVLAASEGYSRKESAIKGLDSVRANLEELNIVGPEESRYMGIDAGADSRFRWPIGVDGGRQPPMMAPAPRLRQGSDGAGRPAARPPAPLTCSGDTCTFPYIIVLTLDRLSHILGKVLNPV